MTLNFLKKRKRRSGYSFDDVVMALIGLVIFYSAM